MVRHGARLAICGRTESRLEAAAEELGAIGGKPVLTMVADVRDAAAIEAGFARLEAEIGPATAVICGAAGNFLARAETISPNGFKAVMDIDLLGSFNCARAGFDQLRRTRGSLLFITGGQARAAYALQAHVAAAKAGVDQLMRSLAVEWGRHGIRVNSLMPGPVKDTEGMRRLAEGDGYKDWEQSVPLGRFAEQDEIGIMAAVLLSRLASYVSGSVVAVDG
ncbi:MAG: SDR family oxidoreductase, partial [Pararhodobacter sp.]|nr:SDR family oxidoreductase [Pararhodobacter sp.]